jgi:predicted amidohydrolase
MGQMQVEGGNLHNNLERAILMIQQAAQAGCAIVVLPECLNLGWTHPSARTLAAPIPGLHSDILCQAARLSQIYVVAGLVELEAEHIYNAAILISPAGNILLKHRKINELDIALDLYSTGEELSVIQTPLGTIGVNICADNLPNSLEIGSKLASMGAEIIFSPSSWAVEPNHNNQLQPYGDLWKGSYTSLAKEHNLTVVGVSDVGWIKAGPWQGHKCIGSSLAVGAGGKIIAQGPYGENAEALIVISIENESHRPGLVIESAQAKTINFKLNKR